MPLPSFPLFAVRKSGEGLVHLIMCMHMCIMCLTPSTWQVQSDSQDDAVLSFAYLVHESASKVNHSGVDAQVITVILSLTCRLEQGLQTYWGYKLGFPSCWWHQHSWENWMKCFMEILNECISQRLLPNRRNFPLLSKSSKFQEPESKK